MDAPIDDKYLEIVSHYEGCLQEYGDNHKGVDWPNAEDARKRYEVMLELVKEKQSTILDFGCGTAELLQFILNSENFSRNEYEYSGLEISQNFLKICKDKFPDYSFLKRDILKENVEDLNFDYVVANGVFTEKHTLSQDEMWTYFRKMLQQLSAIGQKGIAFNVMSDVVDWKREDLFHVSMDKLASFLINELHNRNFVIRNDYGLYEYTVYIYK